RLLELDLDRLDLRQRPRSQIAGDAGAGNSAWSAHKLARDKPSFAVETPNGLPDGRDEGCHRIGLWKPGQRIGRPGAGARHRVVMGGREDAADCELLE